MKAAVIGSRTFNDYKLMCKTLKQFDITTIVSGHAIGADRLSEQYAKENNIPTEIYLPDWNKFGKQAGFLRNTTIIENSEIVIAFWNNASRGTADSIKKAQNMNKKVIIINF